MDERHTVRNILSENLEAIIWVAALVWLALVDPAAGAHFTLCPLKNLGIEWCPGCGLGSAAGYALHGDLAESFRHHLLGIPAILILGGRVARLARNACRQYTTIKSFNHPAKEPVCPTSCN